MQGSDQVVRMSVVVMMVVVVRVTAALVQGVRKTPPCRQD